MQNSLSFALMKAFARAAFALLPISLIAAGAFVAWSGIKGFQTLGERRLWPKALATILEDQTTRLPMESQTGSHELEIHQLRLGYRIAGRDYEGGLAASRTDLHLQKLTGAVGEKFVVIYNPLNPQEIHVQTNHWPGILLAIGILLLIVGFAFIIAGIQRREISGRH